MSNETAKDTKENLDGTNEESKKHGSNSKQESKSESIVEDNGDRKPSKQNNTEEITKATKVKRVEKTEKQLSEKKELQYDELLSAAGELGLYQFLLLLSTFPFYMFGVYTYYSQMFITEVSSNHWCWIPELEHLTYIERRDLAIPSDDSVYGYSRCYSYVANWSEVLETGLRPDETWETIPCQNGWEFDKSEIPYSTIASEQGWVCDRSSYQATAQSIFSVGSILGCIIFGWMSDRYGRIPAAVASNLVGFVGGFASSFTNSFIWFTVCRFIMGLAYDSNYIIIHVLVLEYVAPKYRSILANASFSIFYTIFVTSLPFMALALGHWKLIALATSVPLALVVFTPLLIPESPRWLLSKDRIDDAVQKVLTIGKVNKKPVPPELVERFKWTMQMSPAKENQSIVLILKNPVLRKVLCIICLEYMAIILVFDGLLRNIGYLDYDFFISFAVISVTEFPSMMLLAFVLDILGRRWLTLLVMSVSAVFTFLIIFAQTGAQSLGFATVARFGVNMSYGAAIQWAAEVLPTGVRSSGVAFVHICGFLSLVISPYIVILNDIAYWLPLTVIGAVALLGAVLPLFLPETARKEMPHTFKDAENLMTNQQFCEMPWNKKQGNDIGREVYVNECIDRD